MHFVINLASHRLIPRQYSATTRLPEKKNTRTPFEVRAWLIGRCLERTGFGETPG
jgi:hypothetical protein